MGRLVAQTWLPTTGALWGLLRNHAIGNEEAGTDAFGGQLPAFTSETAVSLAQATTAINNVFPLVEAVVGFEDEDADPAVVVDSTLAGIARSACMYLAAADLEATSGNLTRAKWWQDRADAWMLKLEKAATAVAESDAPGPADNVAVAGLITGYRPPSRLRYADGTERVF